LNELYSINGIIVVDEPYILSESEINNLSDHIDVKTSEIVQSTNKGINIKKIVLFAVIGFVLGCGIVVVFELFNETVKTEEDLENATKLKTLVKINNTDEDISEKFKILRVNIKECKTILITSPEKKDGKTFVAENLEKSFAMLGKKVILLDLTKNENELIKKYNGKGLSDFLLGQDKFIEKYAVESEINNLSILPVGSKMSNLTELLEEPKMKETLSTLEQLYDVVIIDSDNVLESPNTLAIAKISKYSILVSSERKTKLENVVKAKVNIEDVGGSVIGNILNKTK
jgi:capsular exopolysaccharide synthesis family protein